MSTGLCFVAMPLDASTEKAFVEAILPACNELNLECNKGGSDLAQSNIMRDVVKGVYNSDVVVADLTGLSPNVLYEIGISHTLPYDDKTILIAREGTRIPFDLQSYKIVIYKDHEMGVLRRKLVSRIKELMEKTVIQVNPVHDNIGYYDGMVMQQDTAKELHGLSLDNAYRKAQKSLILFGTTLFGLRRQISLHRMKEKLLDDNFEDLSLVMRDPRAFDMSERVIQHINQFVEDPGIEDLLKEVQDLEKLSLYVCEDFVRYSATYVDHGFGHGVIRVTHSIYGSVMELAPSYLLSKQKNPELYDRFVIAWEDIKKRHRKGLRVLKVSNVEELYAFRDKLLNHKAKHIT